MTKYKVSALGLDGVIRDVYSGINDYTKAQNLCNNLNYSFLGLDYKEIKEKERINTTATLNILATREIYASRRVVENRKYLHNVDRFFVRKYK